MGCVYILTNEAMPGLIKIGHTAKTARERANELFSTGVPQPFAIAYEFECDNHEQLETEMHRRLKRYRVNTKREFFEYSADEAYQLLQELQGTSWRKWTSHFLTRFQKMANSVESRVRRRTPDLNRMNVYE